MLNIKHLTICSRIMLAPMAGCTDLPFRIMSRRHGCKFAFYEMLDASGLTHRHKKTLMMLQSSIDDSPVGAQILATNPEQAIEAAHIILENSQPVLVDLNFACPAKKVLKKKAGAYMLKEPKKAAGIVRKLASSVSVPVTVKIRSGFDGKNPKECLDIAKACEESGACAIFMHGRSAVQGYSGRVDYNAIACVKKAVNIPLIASGDVFSPELAKRMFDETSCDGVLVARGALGRPWVFGQVEDYIKSGSYNTPSYEEINLTAKEHLSLYCQSRKDSEKYYIGHLRKIAIWYSKGLPYSKRAREDITAAKSYKEIIDIIDRLGTIHHDKWLKR